MKCAVEMGSGAMIYMPSFIKIGSGIQTLTGRGAIHRDTDTQTNIEHEDRICLLSFFSK
jgi:hypothetical protein